MSIRTALVTTTVVLACLVGSHAADAEDYLSLRAGLPSSALEYERVLSSGVGLSIAGSYITHGRGDDRDTWIGLAGGLKKYFGQHRVFYLAWYPQLIYAQVSQSDFTLVHLPIIEGYISSSYTGKGSQVLLLFCGAAGWRGVWGHFSYGGELGAWVPIDGTVDTKGTLVEESNTIPMGGPTPASREESITPLGRPVAPAVYVYLGYKF